MVSRKLQVVNPEGLHLRPAGMLANVSMKFKSSCTILWKEKSINCKSVINVMAAQVKCGSEIELVCDGPDENEALNAIAEAITEGLGETEDDNSLQKYPAKPGK